MSFVSANLWPFLIYWVIVFVACYVVVEYAQNYFYDETTPAVGLKVALGTMILAALLTWAQPSFDTMFTRDLRWTVLQGIVWFAVFTLVFRFHPQHGAAIGIVTMVLLGGVASMGVDSLTHWNQPRVRTRAVSKPIRRSAGMPPVPAAEKEPAPASK